jgi:hypothetical protein
VGEGTGCSDWNKGHRGTQGAVIGRRDIEGHRGTQGAAIGRRDAAIGVGVQ